MDYCTRILNSMIRSEAIFASIIVLSIITRPIVQGNALGL